MPGPAGPAPLPPQASPCFAGALQKSRHPHATGNRLRAFDSHGISKNGPFPMHMDIILIQPLVALLIGILILIVPRLLNYLIAIYLIFIGLVGLFPHLFSTTV
jgi:hypothetical protein